MQGQDMSLFDPLVHLRFPGSLLSCHTAGVAQALLLRS